MKDVSAPKEMAKFKLNYLYYDYEALYDAKAFLFDKSKEILSIPVSWTEGKGVWRYFKGAFIFNLNPEDGFIL